LVLEPGATWNVYWEHALAISSDDEQSVVTPDK
jgi:hypothetical protein